MKLTYPLPVAIASMAFASGGVNAAPAVDYDHRTHNVVVSLVATWEGEETGTKDKYSQKIINQKISNKQILEALVEDDVINEIKGYSIVMLTDSNDTIQGYYLSKDGELGDPLDDYITMEFVPNVVVEGVKGSVNKDVVKETQEGRTLATLDFDSPYLAFSTQGIIFWKSEYTDADETTFMLNAGLVNLTGDGYWGFPDDGEEDNILVTGDVKCQDGKKSEGVLRALAPE